MSTGSNGQASNDGGFCYLDKYIECTEWKLLFSAALQATGDQVAEANPRRLRLLITVTLPFDPAAASPQVYVMAKFANGFRRFAALCTARPSMVLRVEDFGQLVTGQVTLIASDTSSVNCQVFEISKTREPSDDVYGSTN